MPPRSTRPTEGVPALYLQLLGSPRPTVRSLERAGHPRAFLDRELAKLVDFNMIRIHESGVIEVMPPESAIPAYAAELERQAIQARRSVAQMESIYRRSRGQGKGRPTIDVRVITDLAELEEARDRLMSTAEESIVLVAAGNTLNEQLLWEEDPEVSALLSTRARRVSRQVVIDASLLVPPGTLETMTALAATGARVRVHPSLALTVLVVDQVVALIDISNLDPSGYGSLVIRHPPLVHVLADLTAAAMAGASRLPIASTVAQERLGQREARTLALLSAGLSDAAIARQVGVSVRTIERHVQRLMATVGASTRFQAGVEAARRGLL